MGNRLSKQVNDGGHRPSLVTATLSSDGDLGPRSGGSTSRWCQSQQPNESIHVVVARPSTVFIRHEHLQLHSNALQQPSQVELLQYRPINVHVSIIHQKYCQTIKELLLPLLVLVCCAVLRDNNFCKKFANKT